MPFYNRIDPTTREGERTLERLLALRRQLEEEVPARTLKETLLVATWNIRDFDKSAYGDRLDEAIYYIAEIISHFDLVAIQEVYRDLRGLDRVRAVLGSHWGVNFTDATEGGRGNKERLAFLYDTRKVQFGGLACELVLPPMKDKDGSSVPAEQVWRTPYMCGFKAGWTKFMIATVHILWGASKGEPEDRVSEIRHVAQFLKRRTEDKSAWARNLILLGDFNIFRTDDTTFQELVKAGFQIPEQLQKLPSNAQKVRHYDQIAFRSRKHRLERTGRAGVFDYYHSVFR